MGIVESPIVESLSLLCFCFVPLLSNLCVTYVLYLAYVLFILRGCPNIFPILSKIFAWAMAIFFFFFFFFFFGIFGVFLKFFEVFEIC